ncbi:hypothetical protein, variant [Saprolegnia diclina VS20]|uniref:ELMO domain-containing protein n=1 Tax=Saprolegnia diclina (strain VS20) TaxID=1156394 RepID=T0RW67_SAPDV|nr:hypothetical protein, variant [Saprolegnia diclina VS20]EQC34557.1 hypothetical protein, variant [Saprolegnia diclina VS20]|eukprot:XP_008611963.1 hypothetical protein, variant [Saprolegnia diclina VS20]
MDAALRVTKLAQAHLSIWTRFFRALTNFFFGVFFGQTELERIVAKPADDVRSMLVRLRTSIALDDSLKDTQMAIFGFKPFETDVTLAALARTKKIDLSKSLIAEANLRQSFKTFLAVNNVYAKVIALKDESYDSTNDAHEAMLEELWRNLKPDVRRTGGRHTKEWGEIGFQGTDPMTDFRSMGVLSLHQLLYYTSKYPEEARSALVHSNHPTQWYPFAITGINITNFLVELINDRLLDARFYDKDVHIDELHEFFCQVFTMFDALWVESNPTDLMAFPTIFNHLKATIRFELLEQSFF